MKISTVETNGAYSLIEVDLITGRSHQIRAHMAYLGCPIVGDNKYGDKQLNSFFDTKFTSNEFRLQFNKNFDSMLDFSLVLRDADNLITSLVPEKLRAKETYQKISNCLFDILEKTSTKRTT